MRLAAYKKALDQAFAIPHSLPELKEYFKDSYSPRHAAIQHVLKAARQDIKCLFDGEFVKLYLYAREKVEEERP